MVFDMIGNLGQKRIVIIKNRSRRKRIMVNKPFQIKAKEL